MRKPISWSSHRIPLATPAFRQAAVVAMSILVPILSNSRFHVLRFSAAPQNRFRVSGSRKPISCSSERILFGAPALGKPQFVSLSVFIEFCQIRAFIFCVECCPQNRFRVFGSRKPISCSSERIPLASPARRQTTIGFVERFRFNFVKFAFSGFAVWCCFENRFRVLVRVNRFFVPASACLWQRKQKGKPQLVSSSVFALLSI